MKPDRVIVCLREIGAPHVAFARFWGRSAAFTSNWLRGYCQISENDQEEAGFVVEAMQELSDESPFPPDWRKAEQLRPLIETKVATYRARRSAELRQRFIEGAATAVAYGPACNAPCGSSAMHCE